MANKNEASTTKSSSKSSAEDTNKTNSSTKQTPSLSPIISLTLALLAAIMAVIALIFVGYAVKTHNQFAVKTQESNQALQIAVDNLKNQQTPTKAIDETIQTLNQNQTQLQEHLQALEKELHTAMQQRLYQKQDWVLLKARYYLELAQINAHWSSDQQTTIALLQQADTMLSTLSEQRIYNVRQAIAQEITQLQSLPHVDVAGLLSQLDAVKDNLAGLPLKQPLAIKQNSEQLKHDKSSPWRTQLSDSLDSLSKLVVVRHHDDNIEPLLSPNQQAIVLEAIRMNLQEAQWAILQNNPSVYQLTLTQAMNTIKRSFDETAPNTQALLKQLQTLQQQKLSLSNPLIDKALPLLNEVIESKKIPSTNTSPTEGDHAQ